MVNYLKKLRNEQRRAVAPIIATLIMVAIAVVGGVMVYVFTQGFFTGTQTQAPTTDAITMTGYDAREIAAGASTGVTNHNGVAIVNQGDASTTDGKGDNEELAIHVKNLGTSAVTINKLEVNFVTYTRETAALGAGAPGLGEYAIITGAGAGAADTSLPAGGEATLLISIADADPGGSTLPIASGTSIPVELTTASGSVFTFHVTVGQRE
jgi:flagellin-like protein